MVVQLLLERGANKDIKHNVRATPGPCSGALRCVPPAKRASNVWYVLISDKKL